jgi:hypothetical protein
MTDPESLEMSRSDTALRKGEPATLLALAAGCTAVEAANAGGVTVQTVFRRLREPTYLAQLHALRDAAIGRAANRLASGALDAVESVLELSRRASSDSVRLKASLGVLDRLGLLAEVEQVQHNRAAEAMTVALGTDEQTERIVVVDQTPGGLRVLGVVDAVVDRLSIPLNGDLDDDVALALEQLSIG